MVSKGHAEEQGGSAGCQSRKGIAQVTLSGTAFTQQGRGVTRRVEGEPFPPVSSPLPLPGE